MNSSITRPAKPEILAPGGSVESIYAAMNAGCDAVYMGGKRFGARAFADNPDNDGLLDIMDAVHIQGKKLYLTVNTILGDSEFPALYEYIDLVYRQCVDAVIVQDMGVLGFIHREFPDLSIHASTQMSIVQASSANLLKPYGVTRVVPARELSFEELSEFRKNTDVELEVFVHGALCCSYSGQCLMSSLIGGRSGNKGACAQPCRKLYSYLSGNRTAYELSLKDLCTLEYMPEMIMCGVDSFKIEGRMKKPEYVAITSYMYKKYRDYYFEQGCERYREFIRGSKEYEQDIRKLKDVYNRGGFTAGYLINNVEKSKMMTEKRPNHEGVIVGFIKSTGTDKHSKDQVQMEFSEDVYAQDILEIRNSQGDTIHEHTLKENHPKGSRINIKTGYNYNKIRNNHKVYRIRNSELINNIYKKFPVTMPEMEIDGSLKAVVGEPLELKVWATGDAMRYSCIESGNVVGLADKHAASEEDVRCKVMVSGSSGFKWRSLDINLDDGVFLSPAELKALRRQTMDKLRCSILENYRRVKTDIAYIDHITENKLNQDYTQKNKLVCSRKNHDIIIECRNREQFEAADGIAVVSTIYVHIEDMDMDEVTKIIKETNKEIFIVLPRLFRKNNQEYFEEHYDMAVILSCHAVKGVIVNNLEQLAWYNNSGINTEGRKLLMRTADNMYVRNRHAYKVYKELGADGCSASVEMSEKELEMHSDEDTDILIYGRPSAMIMANRFERDGILKDSYGNEYVVIDHKKTGYSEILHFEPIDRINSIESHNYRRLRLSFTDEGADKLIFIIERLTSIIDNFKPI